MKQNIFETRQRAEQLLNEALSIWQQSDKAEYIEGLQTDPIFRMLINVLAYQANEFDSSLEQLQVELLDEFEQMLFFGEAGKAVPASIAIETTISGNLPEVLLDESHMFQLSVSGKQPFTFMPLLETKVINAKVADVRRLDSRRWLVTLSLGEGVRNISGMTFTVDNLNFHGLDVNLVSNGTEVPLISPWDYANMPMSAPFSLDTLLYNRSQAVNPSHGRQSMAPCSMYTAMDLYARQDLRLFVVDEMEDIPTTDKLEMIFEFESVNDQFHFDKKNFHINVVLLANARQQSVTVSTSDPVVRIAGSGDNNTTNEQFLHLIRPSKDVLYSRHPLQVRRVNADRFNRGRLAKLVNNFLTRYITDYYAFQDIGSSATDTTIKKIRQGLGHLIRMSEIKVGRSYEGVYLILSKMPNESKVDINGEKINVSLDVSYLTTQGAEANVLQAGKIIIHTPSVLDDEKTRAITALQNGFNEVYDQHAVYLENKYYMTTQDRLVTPMDIKLFCYNELMVHYGMVRDMISKVRIHCEQYDLGTYHTYQICIDVNIVDNVFTQHAFGDSIASVENYLEKMVYVRTSGIYPIKVKMELRN